ncbi:MAG TPA: hypothetical protein VF271_08995 [Rhodanobacteraceae bacterium]
MKGAGRCRHAWLVWALALVALPAWAQRAPVLDHFDVGIGSYYATSSTTLGGGLPQGLFNTSVNLEDDLGFDNSESLPRVRADWLVGEHQGLSLDYYRYSRASGRRWQRTLNVQGQSYALDAALHGRVSFAFGSLAWRWWFGDDEDAFGLGIGASHYRASGSIAGHLDVNGQQQASLDADTGTSAWAPLLQVGWRHAINRHWRVYFDAAGVYKNGGKLHGHVYNASLGVRWMPLAHWALALEYGVNSIHVAQSHRYYADSLDVQLYGPSAFVYWRF